MCPLKICVRNINSFELVMVHDIIKIVRERQFLEKLGPAIYDAKKPEPKERKKSGIPNVEPGPDEKREKIRKKFAQKSPKNKTTKHQNPFKTPQTPKEFSDHL